MEAEAQLADLQETLTANEAQLAEAVGARQALQERLQEAAEAAQAQEAALVELRLRLQTTEESARAGVQRYLLCDRAPVWGCPACETSQDWLASPGSPSLHLVRMFGVWLAETSLGWSLSQTWTGYAQQLRQSRRAERQLRSGWSPWKRSWKLPSPSARSRITRCVCVGDVNGPNSHAKAAARHAQSDAEGRHPCPPTAPTPTHVPLKCAHHSVAECAPKVQAPDGAVESLLDQLQSLQQQRDEAVQRLAAEQAEVEGQKQVRGWVLQLLCWAA